MPIMMFNASLSATQELSSSLSPASDLVTPRRADLAVKWRLFRHLLHGGDPDADRIYRWHITARKASNAKLGLGMDGKPDTDRYVSDCHKLLVSMRANGFNPLHAIPIDPDGELLGGAHRTACALALGIGDVPVKRYEQRVWAPAWDREWFVANGMSADDYARLAEDFLTLRMGS